MISAQEQTPRKTPAKIRDQDAPRQPAPATAAMPLRRAAGGCACGGRCPRCAAKTAGDQPLQAKLAIGASNDPLEQEADRIADSVLGAAALAAAPPASPRIQRADGAGIDGAASAPSSVDHVLASAGNPMAAAIVADMSQRFGHDFSSVRVHDDTAAGRSALDINARAYTVGNDIVFGPDRYAPETAEGRHLLAHELTHVVQQSGGSGSHADGSSRPLQPSLIQRNLALSSASAELAAQHAPRMALLLQEYGTLAETGVLATEEAAAIGAAVAEAELAAAAAAEVAAAGATATAVGEGSLVVTAGLVADDVTGIGVADDVVVPFTLIFGLAAIGIGAATAYIYRDEISAALRAAIAAMQRLVHLIEEAIARHRGPAPVTDLPPAAPPVERPTTPPRPAPPIAPPRPAPPPVDPAPRTSRDRRPAPDRRPGPDVDIDLDRRRRRRECSYESIAQQFGRYPCHAAFASRFSGVSREVRVITPELVFADMDAMDTGETLYEVKTGYRWLPFTTDQAAKQRVIARFYTQAANQMYVAERCGHPLKWVFNDPYAASFFGAENSPHPGVFEAPMPVEVWYQPYDCSTDSDD